MTCTNILYYIQIILLFYTDFIFYRTTALYARILWIMIGECSVISLQHNGLKLTISACSSWFWSVISTAVYHWIDHVIKSIGVFATFSVSWNMSFLTLVGRVVEGTSVWNRRCKIGYNASITFTNGDSFFSFSGWKIITSIYSVYQDRVRGHQDLVLTAI